MTYRTGIDAQLGVKVESTYGTGVAVDRFWEFLSEGLSQGAVGKVVGQGLGRGRYPRTDRVRTYAAPVTGPIELEVMDAGMGLLFGLMLNSTPATTDAAPVYTHTATPDANGGYGKSFTCQVGKPGVGGTVHPFTYEGGKVTSWSLASAIGEALKATLNCHFKNLVTSGASAYALQSASYASDAEMLIFVDGALTIGGSAVPVKGFNIDGDNGLDVERMFHGSGLPSEPLAAAIAAITGNIEAEFTDLTAFNAWVAGTQAALVLTFDNGHVVGGSTHQLQVTIPAVEYTGEVPTVGGPGIVQQARPFRALNDGSNPVISFAYRTSDATP